MMSSITKSIQNEYVLLMENAFSEKYKYAFRNLELKELRRFILKELISSPELDNQLTNLMLLLNKFWDTHAAALITEVRASKSYRLLLPIQRFGYNISNHLRSLGIYFDSIIMVDPLHFPSLSSLHSFLSLPPDNSYVRMRRLVLLEHVSNLFRAIPFMTIDDDYPIFLIVPELLDFDKERNHEQSAAFLSQLFFKDRKMDYATYLAFLEHFGRNEETFQKILINKELLKTLLNNFNNIEKEVWVYDTD
ncbi:hypothetical protein E2V58_22855, partial [Salmonella enterica]|nr:hypothetical protein [Salmonella enterica]EIN4555397.1 hypothetical protein [Salmonella enterica]